LTFVGGKVLNRILQRATVVDDAEIEFVDRTMSLRLTFFRFKPLPKVLLQGF